MDVVVVWEDKIEEWTKGVSEWVSERVGRPESAFVWAESWQHCVLITTLWVLLQNGLYPQKNINKQINKIK
jgi:hypothetical protein